MKIRYFPFTEITLFALMSLGTILLYVFEQIPFWLIPLSIIFFYIVTLGRATIVDLNEDVLTITSLSPAFRSIKTSISSITKVVLHQTMEHETDVTFGGSFFVFHKLYELEFNGPDHKKTKAFFSINNRKKEEQIIPLISRHLN